MSPDVRGYVVELPSSQPGVPCYLLTSSGLRATDAGTCFATRADALALLSDARAEMQYRAPETIPRGYAERLRHARVVPIPDHIRSLSGFAGGAL